MPGPQINKQILSAVREKTGDDPVLQKFINEMLFEELEHPRQWWFKEHYKRKIRACSERWDKDNED